MPASPDEIIAAARSLLGVPYHHQGRDPKVALDCIGLCVEVARRVGLPVVDEEGYPMTGAGWMLLRCLDAQYPRAETAQPGDLVACRIRPGGMATHLGIVSQRPDGLGLVHVYARVGKVVEHGYVEPWTTRTLAVYRWGDA